MITILHGDCRSVLTTLPDQSVHCCVTSPPYFGLRDYGVAGQIGLEPTPDAFVAELVAVFREVRRVLRDDGTLWLNLGDSYNNFRSQIGPGQAVHGRDKLNGKPDVLSRKRGVDGLKEKDMIGIPWMVAFALRADGWYLRRDIIWSKPNPMPESVTDRCTTAHEYIFHMSKSARYFYDAEAIKEPGSNNSHGGMPIEGGPKQVALGQQIGGQLGIPSDRNKRSVWEVSTRPYPESHFATFPPALIEPCIKAGCPIGGTVLDPFGGAGTAGLVADRLQRKAILIELNPSYAKLARERIHGDSPLFSKLAAEVRP